jgi:hypothetical protein
MKPWELMNEIVRRNISVTAEPDGRLKVTPLEAARDLLDDMKEHKPVMGILARGEVKRFSGTVPVFPSCRAMLESGEYKSDDPEVRACFMCAKGDPVTFMRAGAPVLTGLCSKKKGGEPNEILNFALENRA